jgi:hypothetical protein
MKGFLAGYRRGKQGIDFIRMLNMPGIAGKLRIISPVLLGILAAMISETMCRSFAFSRYDVLAKLAALIVTVVLFQVIRKGLPTLAVLYGMFALFYVISLTW